MKLFSDKRARWERDYRKMLASWTPDRCARCGRVGNGWIGMEGNLDPHHVWGRTARWKMMAVIPLCRECHDWVHAHPNEARRAGLLI